MSKRTKSVYVNMLIISVGLGALAALFFYLHARLHVAWMMPAAITMLTVFYHLAMRLAVGEAITLIFRGREFPQNRAGFGIKEWEKGLYKKLKVKKWKREVITAKPEQFDLKKVGAEELLHNVMQAELVHRVNVVLSFVPLLFIIPFNEPLVFIITSIVASLVDLQFVIVQRYNRPRVIKLIKHEAGFRGSSR